MSNNQGCLGLLMSFFRIASKSPTPPEQSYQLRKYLLSPTELSFYKVLLHVVENKKTILCKVRMTDIFYTNEPTARNRIAQKHIDFILCDPQTMKPLAAIELDDKSHERADRKERDMLVDSIFQKTGLPIIHIKAQREYNTQQLSGLIDKFINLGTPYIERIK